MANPFYSPGRERAAKVQDLFGTIARRYDLINDLQSLGLHRLWKRRLVRLARLESGQRALDVCCGTGDVTFALARTGAEVIGLDFSREMLRVAEARRVRDAGREPSGQGGTLAFVQGDALHLPFPDASFDAVTISYGLRNLADFEAGLAEMRRVLRTAGRLLVLDFGKPANPLWRALYFAYLRAAVPLFGRLFAGRRGRLRLHPRIASALPGSAGRGRLDAAPGPREREDAGPPRRRHGDQLRGEAVTPPAPSANHESGGSTVGVLRTAFALVTPIEEA